MMQNYSINSNLLKEVKALVISFCKLCIALTFSVTCLAGTSKNKCIRAFAALSQPSPQILGTGSMGRVYKILNLATSNFETHKIYISNKGWREYNKLTTFEIATVEGNILEQLNLIMRKLKLKTNTPRVLRTNPENNLGLTDNLGQKAATLVSEYIEARPYLDFIEDTRVSSEKKSIINLQLIKEMKALAKEINGDLMIHDDPGYPFTLDHSRFKVKGKTFEISIEPEGLIVTKDLEVYIIDPI